LRTEAISTASQHTVVGMQQQPDVGWRLRADH
jgi:hypothetical protein